MSDDRNFKPTEGYTISIKVTSDTDRRKLKVTGTFDEYDKLGRVERALPLTTAQLVGTLLGVSADLVSQMEADLSRQVEQRP